MTLSIGCVAGPVCVALPLNVFAGVTLDQRVRLEIDRTSVADELRGLSDVVLYVDYEATLLIRS